MNYRLVFRPGQALPYVVECKSGLAAEWMVFTTYATLTLALGALGDLTPGRSIVLASTEITP